MTKLKEQLPIQNSLRNKECRECGKDTKLSICETCRSRFYYARNPERRVFYNLKVSAKRRYIEFNLNIDWFIEFCKNNSFCDNMGRNKESNTIDRIDNKKGYTQDNIQILSHEANCLKGTVERSLNKHLADRLEEDEQNDNLPY